jgi:hypothetical protein
MRCLVPLIATVMLHLLRFMALQRVGCPIVLHLCSRAKRCRNSDCATGSFRQSFLSLDLSIVTDIRSLCLLSQHTKEPVIDHVGLYYSVVGRFASLSGGREGLSATSHHY